MKTVLVVEDDKLFRMALKAELEAAGYRVLEAVDCASAQALLGAETLDVAALDYHLPDGAGLGLLEQILRLRLDCPAVLLTAHRTDEGKEQAEALGAYRYMDKPEDLSEVVAVLNEALGGTVGST